MVISGIFGILAFIASIILAVKNNCGDWNCDTVVAGNVGYFCPNLRYHAFQNHIYF